MTTLDDLPPPASKDAIEMGCICPIEIHGVPQGFRWRGKSVYVIDQHCPIHGTGEETAQGG